MISRKTGFAEELGLGEVISYTFDIYKRNFWKFLLFFLPFELAGGLLTAFISRFFIRATTVNPFTALVAEIPVLGFTLLLTLIISSVATGLVIKFASVYIEKESAEIGPSVRFALSRLLSIIAVTVLVAVIVALGFVALIVPGVILGIMFCLAIPVVVIEPSGVIGSLTRARELVSHRWLKTLGLLIVFGLIIGILSLVVESIASIFGGASWIVTSALSALYAPLVPLFLTVYYYSNVARLSPPSYPSAPLFPLARYCRFCGAQLSGGEVFCPACGAKQQA